MDFHGSFHRTTGLVLCQVTLQLRDGFGAVFAGLTPPRCWGISTEEIVFCCSITGATEVAVVQIWASVWVVRGEENKNKALRLVTG